eukprot:366569-Chlamydomonas_euryale.AAC.2
MSVVAAVAWTGRCPATGEMRRELHPAFAPTPLIADQRLGEWVNCSEALRCRNRPVLLGKRLESAWFCAERGYPQVPIGCGAPPGAQVTVVRSADVGHMGLNCCCRSHGFGLQLPVTGLQVAGGWSAAAGLQGCVSAWRRPRKVFGEATTREATSCSEGRPGGDVPTRGDSLSVSYQAAWCLLGVVPVSLVPARCHTSQPGAFQVSYQSAWCLPGVVTVSLVPCRCRTSQPGALQVSYQTAWCLAGVVPVSLVPCRCRARQPGALKVSYQAASSWCLPRACQVPWQTHRSRHLSCCSAWVRGRTVHVWLQGCMAACVPPPRSNSSNTARILSLQHGQDTGLSASWLACRYA